MKNHSKYYLPYKTEYSPQTTKQRVGPTNIVTNKKYTPYLDRNKSDLETNTFQYSPYQTTIKSTESFNTVFREKEKKVLSYSPSSATKPVVSNEVSGKKHRNFNFLSKILTRIAKEFLKWITNLSKR